VWWFANLPQPHELSPRELAAISPADWKNRLVELFSGDKAPATRIIEATTDDDLVPGFNQYDMPSVPVWSRGPIGLVGDAAHAVASSSGQGCSMAFEDAVVLATCLRDEADSARALATFQRLRRERVERVIAHGAKTSSDKAARGLQRVITNMLTPFFLKRAAKEGVAPLSWMFDHHIDWGQPADTADTR
jgi:FAD-dependent urate hydroxylase